MEITLHDSHRELVRIAGVVALFVLLIMVGGSHAESVDLGGWNFTINTDGWRHYGSPDIGQYDSSKIDYDDYDCDPEGTWKVVAEEAFYYPVYPNAPKGNEYYEQRRGRVALSVLKIPNDLRNDLRERSIAIYGSPEKIPEDQKQQELIDILRDAARIEDLCEYYTSKMETIFDGDRIALLSFDRENDASIAILLDNDTVGIIEVIDIDSLPNRSRDVINSFTVSPI
jgi:hypothetical protein